jgi:tetratricopeptide (TPR) repeat protein
MQPAFAQIRFAAWDDILATPQPDPDLLYARAVWHYARGRALLGKGDVAGAAGEAEALAALQQQPTLQDMRFFETQSANDLLDIAALVLAGELSAARGELAAATDSLRRAVALEDALPYNEPPFWFHPVRHSLGAVQLAAGDPRGAEATYRQDLAIMRENGWALLGLAQALHAQGRTAEAEAVRARFDTAWQHADVQIASSRL